MFRMLAGKIKPIQVLRDVGFRHVAVENCALPGYYAASGGNSLPAQRSPHTSLTRKLTKCFTGNHKILDWGNSQHSTLPVCSVMAVTWMMYISCGKGETKQFDIL
jgi:hypothetical protein